MKALKSHPQIERPRRVNSRINLAKYTAGLVLALVGLILNLFERSARRRPVELLL
jgi:hypothetical protein